MAYHNLQTIRHKTKNFLVRLGTEEEYRLCAAAGFRGTTGALGGYLLLAGTTLVREDGSMFLADLADYDCVRDELGRPVGGLPADGEWVDTRLKKYLVSAAELLRMRQKKLFDWEQKVMATMKLGHLVLCPFADGSRSIVFQKFFLERRGAIPLYVGWDTYHEVYKGYGALLLEAFGKPWVFTGGIAQSLTRVEKTQLKNLARFIDELWY